jgi:hypothetical protein
VWARELSSATIAAAAGGTWSEVTAPPYVDMI